MGTGWRVLSSTTFSNCSIIVESAVLWVNSVMNWMCIFYFLSSRHICIYYYHHLIINLNFWHVCFGLRQSHYVGNPSCPGQPQTHRDPYSPASWAAGSRYTYHAYVFPFSFFLPNFFVCLLDFWDRFPLCSPSGPGPHFIDQASPRDLPTSASWVLRLKAWATLIFLWISNSVLRFFSFRVYLRALSHLEK